MLEKEKDIDALTISTPDHNHAKIAYDCMNRGIHVYVQKPLTHTIAEARLLAQTAEKNKIVTQMGNQGGSSIGVPKIQEWIDQNKIGKVTSAVYSPRLKKNIALAIIEIDYSDIGNKLKVFINSNEVDCTVIEKPFYDPKKKLASFKT